MVTGKRPVTGNNVSHSQRKTRRRFLPNLHWHRFWVESENKFVRLRVSSKGMRINDKKARGDFETCSMPRDFWENASKIFNSSLTLPDDKLDDSDFEGLEEEESPIGDETAFVLEYAFDNLAKEVVTVGASVAYEENASTYVFLFCSRQQPSREGTLRSQYPFWLIVM